MGIDELAVQYEQQYQIISNKMDGLRPLLYVYRGEDLLKLRRKMKIYYDMAVDCRRISRILQGYYEED